MRILLLNQTFHPDVMATAQYLSELAVALVEQGHQVTVVTSRCTYDHPERAFPARETWKGIRIVRIGSTRFGKRAKWRRAVDFASFMTLCALRLLLLPRQDVTLALTTPPLISFVGAWFTRIRGGRFCYWVMDMNPDEAVAAGWLDPQSFAGRWLERFSRFSFRTAARIIALDRFMKERIVAKGIDPGKVAVIPPWSQDTVVRYDEPGRGAFRQAHGLQDKFVVMYSGNHSPVHPLDTLMAAAEQLKDEPAVKFLFVGGGSEFTRVQSFAKDKGLTNILCLPYQPFDQLSASLSAADLHAVVLGEAFVGLVHPCKLYNTLRVGAPVLYVGPSPSHVTELLEQLPPDHRRISVRHGEVNAVVDGIRALQHRAGEKRAEQALPPEYSCEHQLPRLITALLHR